MLVRNESARLKVVVAAEMWELQLRQLRGSSQAQLLMYLEGGGGDTGNVVVLYLSSC